MDWQGRASELVNLIDPTRSFAAGEFENLTDEQWRDLVTDLRVKVRVDDKLELARQERLAREAARETALAKLTPEEIAALRE
jgi:oligoendopeptidase F